MKPKFKSKMKLLLLLTSLLSSTITYPEGNSVQSSGGYNYYGTAKPNINDYLKSEIKSAFAERFKDDNKNDFKSLREFLKEKEDLSRALNEQKDRYTYDFGQIARKEENILRLEEIISTNLLQGQSTYNIPPYLISDYTYYDSGNNILMTKDEIQKKIAEIKQKNKTLKDDLDKNVDILNKNIKNVEQDIYNCIKRIDSALAPEYENQDFRINISICFTILIGILLISFFYIVYQKSDNTLSKELLSGNGLQFVTLFVLIIAIILFGILSILQGSELAAILSGISGYILGKGITPEERLRLLSKKTVDTPPKPKKKAEEEKTEATQKKQD